MTGGMISIDISSDIDAALKDVGQFARRELPFGTSGAINDTMFDVRKRVTTSTFDKAFEVRNRRFAGRLWQVTQKARKGHLEAMLTQTLDRGYMQDHVTGGTKTGRTGGRVAIPAQPGKMRSGQGRIRKNLKPRSLEAKKTTFVVAKGSKKFIMRRQRGGGAELLYSIVPSAKIDRRFRFYEDAMDTTLRVFSGHWNTRMTRAIATSRFFPD